MITKNQIIFILLGIITIWLFLTNGEEPKIVVKTVIKIDTIYRVVDNTKPQSVKKVFIKLTDTVKESDTVVKLVYKNKLVNQFYYKDSLENGIVESTILADTIYKRDIRLKTWNKTITNNITKTVYRSQLYLGGTIRADLTVPGLGVWYSYKNKALIGVGAGLDNKKAFTNLTIAIGL
jgi:hypothetical protein